LLTKEDEVFLFTQIEKGQESVRDAISQTCLGAELSEDDDIDELAAEIEMIAKDIFFLEEVINDIDSGKKLTKSQVTRLTQIAGEQSQDLILVLKTQDQELLHNQAVDIARKVLGDLRSEFGLNNEDLGEVLNYMRCGTEIIESAKKEDHRGQLASRC